MLFCKCLKNKKGFTLTELLLVTIILAVISSLTIPRFYSTTEKVRSAEGVRILESVLHAYKLYQFENSTPPTAMADVDVEISGSAFFDETTIQFDANCDGGAATSASCIVRLNNATQLYRMHITPTGVIQCQEIAANSCNHLGYEDYPN